MRKLIMAMAIAATALALPALAAPTAADIGLENVAAAANAANKSTAAAAAIVMNDSIDMRGAAIGQANLGDRPADGATYAMHAVLVVRYDESVGADAVMVLAGVGDRPADGNFGSFGNITSSIVDPAGKLAALSATNLAAAGAVNTT